MKGLSTEAAIRGKKNKAAGALFEQTIETACREYRRAGAAEISKTPEPMRPVRGAGQGRYIAFYEKKAQPDFQGTLAGGRSVVFEAKYTATGKLMEAAVKEHQAEALERHTKLGAVCFILCGFGDGEVYRVPWATWREMKSKYGRRYVTPADLQEYKVTKKRGIIDFLERSR